MKVYLAAPFEQRASLAAIRDRIHQETPQHRVVSSWLAETAEQIDEQLLVDCRQALGLARRDLGEIDAADLLIVETLTVNARGGSQVEYGYALGVGKSVWVVGPVRNIFHNGCTDSVFPTWDKAIRELQMRA